MSQICQLRCYLCCGETTLVASFCAARAFVAVVCIEVSLRTRDFIMYFLCWVRAFRGWLFEWHLTRPKKTASRWYKSAHTKAVGGKYGSCLGGKPSRRFVRRSLLLFCCLRPSFSHAAVSPVWQTHAHEYNVYKQGFLNEVDNGRTRLRSRRFYGLTNFYSRAANAFWPTSEAKRVSQQSLWIQEDDVRFLCAILMHLKPRSQILKRLCVRGLHFASRMLGEIKSAL